MTCKETQRLRWRPLQRGCFRSTPCRAVVLCVILTLPAIFRTWTRQRKLVTDTSSWSNLLIFPNAWWVVEPKRSCKIIYLGSLTTVTQRLKIKEVDLFLLKCANLFFCTAITHAWCTENACGNYLRLREGRGTSVRCQRHESTMLHKQGRAELSLFSFLTPFYSVPIVRPGMLGAEEAAISRERRVQTSEGSWTRKPLYQVFQNEGFQGRECGSVVGHRPSVHKVLGLTLSTTKSNNKQHTLQHKEQNQNQSSQTSRAISWEQCGIRGWPLKPTMVDTTEIPVLGRARPARAT